MNDANIEYPEIPRRADKLVSQVIGKVEKPFLTPERFKSDIESAQKLLFRELKELPEDSLFELFTDYLYASDFIFAGLIGMEPQGILRIYRRVNRDIQLDGLALVIEKRSDLDKFRGFIRSEPDFLVLYDCSSEIHSKEIDLPQQNVSVVTHNDMTRFLMFLLIDQYFDLFFMTITGMPGFKKQIWSILGDFGIDYEEYQKVSRRWRALDCRTVDCLS